MWTSAPGGLRSVEQLPDGGASLLFRLTSAGGDLSVAGPRTVARYKQVASLPLYVRVCFRPGGASAFFGVPTTDLADQVVLLETLWGPDTTGRLLEDLGRDGAIVADRLEESLVARLRAAPGADSPMATIARRAARAITEGDRTFAEIAAGFGVSERHLRRTFLDVVGVTPKALSRMWRLRRVFTARERTRVSWSEAAVGSGYFDQSHLIAESRALLRMTPEAFVGRRGTPNEAC